MGLFILWIVFSFIIAFIGSDREIGFFWSLLACLILSPLIGLIITLVSKDKKNEAHKKQLLEALQKQNELNTTSHQISYDQEVRALQKLQLDGVITEEEFIQKKRKLLGLN